MGKNKKDDNLDIINIDKIPTEKLIFIYSRIKEELEKRNVSFKQISGEKLDFEEYKYYITKKSEDNL